MTATVVPLLRRVPVAAGWIEPVHPKPVFRSSFSRDNSIVTKRHLQSPCFSPKAVRSFTTSSSISSSHRYSQSTSMNFQISNTQVGRISRNRNSKFVQCRMTASSTSENINATTLDTNDDTLLPKTTWNLSGLRKEVSRATVRCHKKIGKASQRLQAANDQVDRLTSKDDATLDELEACPNLDALQKDVVELQTRLKQLNQLEVLLQDVKGKGNVQLPEHIAQLAVELQVDDQPTQQPERGPPKKDKGPKTMTSFRLPYRRFYTENKTEIRVGKQANDNDELSLSPEHRDSLDWWMHASGCPGSHVIIRCHDQQLDDNVVMDAAALAARQSKCHGSVIKVSMVRARDVKKPPGAKPGLVQLTGSVRTVTVNMKEAKARLERLDKTVLIN
ncbi:DUF814 RNA-binding domain protein [Nitzschia inconspicua]|uniref:DUF814 RNA-binding domain protein n=1 Tax=Nitzschia inconspicua TaxID=303405 RepID=A0A9K3Q427_9STRA|nr:DUF814 RNA-binding domain protein [Nitzschia inconspicua]